MASSLIDCTAAASDSSRWSSLQHGAAFAHQRGVAAAGLYRGGGGGGGGGDGGGGGGNDGGVERRVATVRFAADDDVDAGATIVAVGRAAVSLTRASVAVGRSVVQRSYQAASLLGSSPLSPVTPLW